MSDNFLWVEKYRPNTINDVILPSKLKNAFSQIVETGEMQNMIFHGGAGIGKTTTAKALCVEMGCDFIVINGSDDRNIDMLRTKVRQFATSVSLDNSKTKVVIIDEADYLNANSVQPALRGAIEEFSDNCRFIFTCNFPNKIMEALHSRCLVIDFDVNRQDLSSLAMDFFKRICKILEDENVEYDRKAVAALISENAPDWRKCLNLLQQYSRTGKIDAGVLVQGTKKQLDTLLDFLKAKDFTKVRKWIGEHKFISPASIFRAIYDGVKDDLEPQLAASIIIILAEYQYKHAHVADPEINLVACCVEVMGAL